MYYPAGETTQVATITPDILLEGNISSCDTENYLIQLSDTGFVGYYFEGVGEVEVNQGSIYLYTITNTSGNSCFGTITIQGISSCPGINTVNFPPDLSLTIVGLNNPFSFDELTPESLVDNYGYSHEETSPTLPLVFGCNNLGVSYDDQLFYFDNESFEILRNWTVIDWLTGDIATQTQVIENNITLGLICDFLPNSADFGDCESGHTDSDDVEWPDDLMISDYRINPEELVSFSDVDPNDSKPILVNNANLYSVEYIDVLNQLEVNLMKVNRVWTISTINGNIATYTQKLDIDITGFASLVQANTISNRPIPDVILNNSILTNVDGIAYVNEEVMLVEKTDESRNGVTILDAVLIQKHILGLEQLNDLQIKAADFNLDDRISAVDIIQLRKNIQEVSDQYDSEWSFIDYTDSFDLAIEPKANFIGFKKGDVDDDANLGSSVSLETAYLNLEDVLINNGESYESKLQLRGEQLILGMEVHMYYDQNLITIDSMGSELPSAGFFTYNIDIPGEIHFTVTNSSTTGFNFSNEDFIKISFTANSNGLLNQAINDIQSRNSYIVNLDTELVSLEFEFVDQIDTGNKDISSHKEFFRVYPNPASDNLTFDFLESTPNNFKINIYNISGQLVTEHYNENNIDVSALHSGIHFYRLINDGQTYSGRITIVK